MGTRAETTKKEKAILKFIETQVLENGYPPSVREIGKAIGLSSTATVHAYLEKLEKENSGIYIYNLGTGVGYSVLDMVKAFEESTGKKVNYKRK